VEVINTTGMLAEYTLGLEPSGREHLVVVVKGTFDIPKEGEEPQLSEQQVPFIYADAFTGEPAYSAPVYESDFCLTKPRCDVLLNGSAYAPGGRPVDRVRVGMRIGAVSKVFDVVGDRVWLRDGLSLRPSAPQPFVAMAITYDRAYGGTDSSDPDNVTPYLKNPIGVGYHPRRPATEIEGRPLPNTEQPNVPVDSVTGSYEPMSFGPLGRSWPPRIGFAGTYDDKWLAEVFPFLPADFDEQYFQAAPPDQQTAHPQPGEEVILVNLTPEGRTSFRLPACVVAVECANVAGDRRSAAALIDTIVIEPDAQRFSVIWRVSFPLKRNLLEMDLLTIGPIPPGWRKARDLGKAYRGNLLPMMQRPK